MKMKRNQLTDELTMLQRRPVIKTSAEFYEWAQTDEEEVIMSFVHAFNLFEIFENRLFDELKKNYVAAGWAPQHIQRMIDIASTKTDWGNNNIVADKLHRIGQTPFAINLSKAK
jgi:hypothetical protein